MLRLKRLTKSFTYAFKGLFKIFKEEQNLRVQVVTAFITLAFSAYLGISKIEWGLIILCIGLVILMEVINSAIERVADVLKPRIDNYVKEIKDIMAAAVMLASIISVIIGLIIFLPYIWQ